MKISEIAKFLNATVIGDDTQEISHLCKIDQATPGGLSFLANVKYSHFLEETEATAVLVKRDVELECDTVLLQVDDPYVAFVRAVGLFYELPNPIGPGIHQTAVIHERAKIGVNCHIGANVYIGADTTIGDNAIIYPNVVIMQECSIGDHVRLYPNVSMREHTQIGNNVTIHNGTVLGSDGFGFAPNLPHGFEKIYQTGYVRIEDDVEIGANCAIDRATIGETVIRKGTKLDNLIQVAHNVEIGENNVIAGITAIAGSTKIGSWNQIGGHVAISGHLTIGDQNKVGGASAIAQSIEHNETVMGYPAVSAMEFKRIHMTSRKLPDMNKQLKKLKKQVEELENRLNENESIH